MPAFQCLIEGLQHDVVALGAENATLKQEDSDLRREIDQNSSNIRKSHSSDIFLKYPFVLGSFHGATDKKCGGQIGHKGDTLRSVAKPDNIERYDAAQCAHCAAALTTPR